jgi:hypothetical protein
LKREIIEDAKTYWLEYFPLDEMPRIASAISEGYRLKILTEYQALSCMVLIEKDIKDWIKKNNILDITTK